MGGEGSNRDYRSKVLSNERHPGAYRETRSTGYPDAPAGLRRCLPKEWLVL